MIPAKRRAPYDTSTDHLSGNNKHLKPDGESSLPSCLCPFCQIAWDTQELITRRLGAEDEDDPCDIPINLQLWTTLLLVSKCWRARLTQACRSLEIQDAFGIQYVMMRAPHIRLLAIMDFSFQATQELVRCVRHLRNLQHLDFYCLARQVDAISSQLADHKELVIFTDEMTAFLSAIDAGKDLRPFWSTHRGSVRMLFEHEYLGAVTPLGLAAYRGVSHLVRELIERGAEVNTQSLPAPHPVSPFHLAVYGGSRLVQEILLQHGALPCAQDIELAMERRNAWLIEYLGKHAPEGSELKQAVEPKLAEMVKFLEEAQL